MPFLCVSVDVENEHTNSHFCFKFTWILILEGNYSSKEKEQKFCFLVKLLDLNSEFVRAGI